ncbi:30S ribosomal protein S27ae [Nanoarchaeota archaeon]
MGKKKERKKKPGSHKYKHYEVSGNELKRTQKFCPKCGVGVFMAKHKDREVCGQCGYTEFGK